MVSVATSVLSTPKKAPTTVSHKISDMKKSVSLIAWANLYFEFHVVGSPSNTVEAKTQDLSKFLGFFSKEIGHDHVDSWTPAVTKHFLMQLSQLPLPGTGRALKATSINRVLATLSSFASWIEKQRPFLAGNPLIGVKTLKVDAPHWNGLTSREVLRLKTACEQRINGCTRKDQNPLLEVAVFYVLLHTGMREAELVALNRHQYHTRGFHDVKRKASRVTAKIPCPAEAKEKLDAYLEALPKQDNEPLFTARYGKRLLTRDVQRICERIAEQASAHLSEEEAIHLTPHMLRHTFLKRIADKHGVHVAQQMSGNISMREVFRYTKPSAEEVEKVAESAFTEGPF
jgi:integrase/recombinase XerD